MILAKSRFFVAKRGCVIYFAGMSKESPLKARRKELGLSLRDVERASHFQMSNAWLSQLENGKIKSPSLSFTCALAVILKVSVDQMIEWLEPKFEEPRRCPTCKQVVWPPEGTVIDG